MTYIVIEIPILLFCPILIFLTHFSSFSKYGVMHVILIQYCSAQRKSKILARFWLLFCTLSFWLHPNYVINLLFPWVILELWSAKAALKNRKKTGKTRQNKKKQSTQGPTWHEYWPKFQLQSRFYRKCRYWLRKKMQVRRKFELKN